MSSRSRTRSDAAPLLGRVVLNRPPSFALATWAVALSVVSLLVYLMGSQYAQRVRAQGLLAPDVADIDVSSPSPGQIVQKWVQEGQAVKAGEVLFVISPPDNLAPRPDAPSPPPTTVTVTAPVDGVVRTVLGESGRPTNSGPLLTLAPAGAGVQAQLFLPARQAERVQPGQRVMLRHPHAGKDGRARYEGKVLDVATSATLAPELPPALNAAEHGANAVMYRVRVTLNGALSGKVAGQPVEAEIIQGARPLFEAAFESPQAPKERS